VSLDAVPLNCWKRNFELVCTSVVDEDKEIRFIFSVLGFIQEFLRGNGEENWEIVEENQLK
jgi:hypothetical protein